MMSNLVKFSIIKLWGEKNVTLRLNNNRLILVGENGSGKTTILRILYEALACEFALLTKEDFDHIILDFGKEKVTLYRDEMPNTSNTFELIPRFYDELPPPIRRKIIEYRESTDQNMSVTDVLMLFEEYGFIHNEMYKQLLRISENEENETLAEKRRKIKQNLGCNIIYLPTYRRAEKRIGYLKERKKATYRYAANKKFLNETNDRAIEIFRTGMDDVDSYIQSALDNIRNQASMSASRLIYQCFKGILTKESNRVKYDNKILSAESIENVFGSINESFLSLEENQQIKDLLMAMNTPNAQSYEQIVYYFYSLLYGRYTDLKKQEQIIVEFFRACNEYLYNKQFVYDEKEYAYSIKITANYSNREIKLEELSSGEKQVVSIFSYLYLSPLSKSLVLIDEPELSLSVPWQKRFLVDISNGQQCAGIISVTHSPFVYDNELRKYAHSLEEFIQ